MFIQAETSNSDEAGAEEYERERSNDQKAVSGKCKSARKTIQSVQKSCARKNAKTGTKNGDQTDENRTQTQNGSSLGTI